MKLPRIARNPYMHGSMGSHGSLQKSYFSIPTIINSTHNRLVLFQPYFSPGLPRKGLGESYMFVSQPLWRFFCIVITSLSRLLREHFPGLYWRAWRCRTWSWATCSNSCISFPWAPTLVSIMGIFPVSQPSDSTPCSYCGSESWSVHNFFWSLQLMILFASFSPLPLLDYAKREG
jgi:hypothetical protein